MDATVEHTLADRILLVNPQDKVRFGMKRTELHLCLFNSDLIVGAFGLIQDGLFECASEGVFI